MMSLGKKRVIVTGATGMVASEFINYFKSDYEIMALTRSGDLHIDEVKVVQFSLTDFSGLKQTIIDFKPVIIINTAFYLSSGSSTNEINEFIESVRFTNHLLNAVASIDNMHWIEMRSFSEFEFFKNDVPREKASYLYSVYKSFSSNLVHWYSIQNTNIKVTELVLFTVYGKRSRGKKVIDFLFDAIGSREKVVFSSGIQRLDFIHISDVLTAIRHSIDFQNERIWVGTGTTKSIKELATLIKSNSSRLNVFWDSSRDRPNDLYYAKAPTELNDGWRAKVPIEKGVVEYMNYINEFGES